MTIDLSRAYFTCGICGGRFQGVPDAYETTCPAYSEHAALCTPDAPYLDDPNADYP